MDYSFEIVGISPILSFFNHQQTLTDRPQPGAEYLGTYRCTLDAWIDSVQQVPPRRQWNLDRVVDSIIQFWLQNDEAIQHWKQRFVDAGSGNLLVARVADIEALKVEFESLLE